jgi:hypothetical protein
MKEGSRPDVPCRSSSTTSAILPFRALDLPVSLIASLTGCAGVLRPAVSD